MVSSTEQVSKFHPDKACDQISDALLAEYLKKDRAAHCGIETLWKGTTVVVAGEVKSRAKVDVPAVVHRVADKLGYEVCDIQNLISEQSPEINKAVTAEERIGAGDQGIMFGYATSESESFLPYNFDLANRIIKVLEDEADSSHGILLGDAKVQVTGDNSIGRLGLQKILVSVCHAPNYKVKDVREYIRGLLPKKFPEIKSDMLLINPSGDWTIGGPTADCGLTGRKIVCDQYGGYCPVGGGAFSGKDPSKVDRSASYMARQLAVSILGEFALDTVQVQLAYAIGVPEPVSINIDAYPASDKFNVYLANYIKKHYDLTPKGIIGHLHLLHADYEKIAEGCHYRIGGAV